MVGQGMVLSVLIPMNVLTALVTKMLCAIISKAHLIVSAKKATLVMDSRV